jgi:tetratricopeptide (TPR) repeat protein
VDYLREVCLKSDAEFPKDLHPERLPGSQDILNGPQLARVQQTLEQTLPHFFKAVEDRGQGRYYLYAVVAEPEGMSAFEGEDKGNLLRDSYAGNRYLHMTQMAMRNLVVNNPVLQDRQYHLEFATRVLSSYALGARQKKVIDYQATQLGMDKVRTEDGTELPSYHLTTANSYISALSSAVMEDKRTDLEFNLNVQPIQYTDNEINNHVQSFMLLADMVCSAFQPALTGEHAAQQLQELANSFTTHNENMIWCYHDVDLMLRDAYQSQLDGRWFDSMLALQQICSDSSEQAAFYQARWVPIIEQKLHNDVYPRLMTEAAQQLQLHLQKPTASPVQCRNIANKLWNIVKDEEDPAYDRCRYLLHNCQMVLCNHEGNHEKAAEHYRYCESYAASVPLNEYLQLRNQYSVTLLDRQEFAQALENTQKTLQLAKFADDLLGQILEKPSVMSVDHGRTQSQLGQCLAFLGHHQEAEQAFLTAEEAFSNSPEDLQITRSYRLHNYFEAKDRKGYDALAQEYFGAKDLTKQFETGLDREETSLAYALLVYLKGWYTFPPANIYTRHAEQILEQVLCRIPHQGEHPWELVWKYAVLLARKYKVKKLDVESVARERLQTMCGSTTGLLHQICEESLQSCLSGKDASNLPYMYH